MNLEDLCFPLPFNLDSYDALQILVGRGHHAKKQGKEG